MDSYVYCINNKLGKHSFFLLHNGKKYYMFSQAYHTVVNSEFSKNSSIKRLLNTKCNNKHLGKTLTKITSSIKYLEKEYDIKVLNNTIKKGIVDKRRKYNNIDYYC